MTPSSSAVVADRAEHGAAAGVLGLVHTVASLVPTFAALAAELLPGSRLWNIVDDSLLTLTRESGSVSPSTKRRLAGHVWSALDAGADVVLVTCSSMGSAVEEIRPLTSVPLLRVDEPMVQRAVRTGTRIGILATLATTLEPTVDLVRRTAAAAGRSVEIVDEVVSGAFEAVLAGDTATHDALVAECLARISSTVDVVLLAQASMARVVDEQPLPPRVPVLSSPRSAIEAAREVLAASVRLG